MADGDAFANELVDLIARHYPGALGGDAAECGIVSCKLAESLGGLLAFAYFNGSGQRSAMTAAEIVVNRMIESMMATIRNAEQTLEGS
jgi:hypothetical protein